MSIKYSLALMSTKPGDDTAKKMYYAKAQTDGVVTMDEMAEEISYATSLTDGDVLNVLRALIRQMKVQLAAGKIVKMENFGTFQIQVCSTGTETKKEFTANNITAAHIQFRPGKMVKVATRSEALSFTKVTGKKESIVDDPTDPSEPSNPGDSGNGEAPDPAA
ncbi:HU family DNA-binding protein [Bacteroides ovatus]|nr:HU family DNA-binding protein [Bacteroides ovatus]